ncbi:MAG TPA: transcription termination factor NusA [Patescibacteria group bacterium]|nr:transcription termination factor NusA [Patescibacteria group bacterium]
MASPIVQAIQQICEEKNIPYEVVLETVESALAAAYRKDFGNKNQNLKVEFDPETTKTRVFDEKLVVEDQELPTEEELAALEAAQAAGAVEPEPELDADGNPIKRFNPKLEIMITEAKAIKPDAELGETLRMELEVPGEFGRMAAQTAKQVIIQKLREAERENVFGEFKGREGEIVSGIISRKEGRLVLVDLGRTMATMPPEEQIPGENYAPGQRVKVYVSSVTMTTRGPMVIVSRAHPDIVRKLFSTEIPEVASGAVKIHSVAREAGSRSKVAVSSDDANIDPIGSCIGQRGTRIQTIISELGGEKVDVILHDADPAVFIGKALAPAKVKSVDLDEQNRVATVRADADQLSLAIGKGGQNVRLASRLTGWKINVMDVNEGKAAPAPAEEAPAEEAPKAEEEGQEKGE